MAERFKYTDRLVISFVGLGLLLLIAFSALVLIKNKTLVDKAYFQTILDDASGLSSKPPVYFKGLQIGRIDEFELNSETNDIEVRFYVYKEYADKIIKYAVIARIESIGLGTSKQFEILLPKQELIAQLEPLEEGDLVPFINSRQGQLYAEKGQIAVKLDSLEAFLARANDVLVNLKRETNPESGAIFANLEKFSEISDSVLTTIEQARDERIIPEVKNSVLALQALIDSAEKTVIKAERTFSNADSAFKNMDEFAVSAEQLAKNAIELTENATKVANHADKLLENYDDPSEIISRVSGDKIPGVIDKVDVNLNYMQEILREIFLQREQLAMAIITLNKTLAEFDRTLQGVNNNPLLKDGIETEDKVDYSIEVN